jgi:hypothetical protein
MARGWESKAVEAQQEAALAPAARHRPASADPEVQRQRDTLMLARTRALSDLQLACAPAYRNMLEQVIAEIDRQLGALT